MPRVDDPDLDPKAPAFDRMAFLYNVIDAYKASLERHLFPRWHVWGVFARWRKR